MGEVGLVEVRLSRQEIMIQWFATVPVLASAGRTAPDQELRNLAQRLSSIAHLSLGFSLVEFARWGEVCACCGNSARPVEWLSSHCRGLPGAFHLVAILRTSAHSSVLDIVLLQSEGPKPSMVGRSQSVPA